MAKDKAREPEAAEPGMPSASSDHDDIGSPEVADPDALAMRQAALEAEVAQLRERAARARADYDNLHKRVTRDAALERDRAKARVLESFIPLLELAHMAAHQAEAHPVPLSEGVVMLAREFDRLVQREGLEPLGAVGETADATRHEVLAQEAADGVASGHVSRVIQPGYLLGDKVMRYAKVCVAP